MAAEAKQAIVDRVRKWLHNQGIDISSGENVGAIDNLDTTTKDLVQILLLCEILEVLLDIRQGEQNP